MPSCELCGAQGYTSQAQIEGSRMFVCKSCSNFGRSIKTQAPKRPATPVVDKILVSNYHAIIRNARQRRQLTQGELAKAVAEKESVIQHLEAAASRPSDQLARKLEKFLDINLFEEPSETAYMKLKSQSGGLTLGDLIKKK